jgi:hypothetical protein
LLRRPLRWRLGVRVCGEQIGGEGMEVGGEPGVEASPPPASVALTCAGSEEGRLREGEGERGGW